MIKMKQLWAPWRMSYIVSKKPKECFFCKASKERRDMENYVLYRGKKCFIMLNAFPYNNGHLMIAPYNHIEDIEKISNEEIVEIMNLLKLSIRLLNRTFKPHGFNIGFNLGKIAGAGERHIHMHVVPRWMGDTNFMPIIANTKVISDSLKHTYQELTKNLKYVT